MRLIKIFILLLVLTVTGFATTFVQQAVATSPTGTPSALFSPSSGNGVIAVISYSSIAGIDLSPRLVGGTTQNLTQVANTIGNGIVVEVWYILNILPGHTSCSFTIDTIINANINCSEWNGLTNDEASNSVSNTALASSAVNTNSVTPNVINNLIIAIGGWTANNYSSGPVNAFVRMTPIGGGAVYQESAYKIQPLITVTSTGWTLTAGINWATVIIPFEGTASGPTNAQRSAGFFMPPNEL